MPVIKSVCEDATTPVKVNGSVSKAFALRVSASGFHTQSTVLEALSQEFRGRMDLENKLFALKLII